MSKAQLSKRAKQAHVTRQAIKEKLSRAAHKAWDTRLLVKVAKLYAVKHGPDEALKVVRKFIA